MSKVKFKIGHNLVTKMGTTAIPVGIILMIIGAVLGVWGGFFWAFIGGIANIIDLAQMNPVDGTSVAWSVLRVMSAGLIGAVAFFAGMVPGFGMLLYGINASNPKKTLSIKDIMAEANRRMDEEKK